MTFFGWIVALSSAGSLTPTEFLALTWNMYSLSVNKCLAL